jgi:hypothetical protein
MNHEQFIHSPENQLYRRKVAGSRGGRVSEHFDGSTFSPVLDGPRLGRQLAAVHRALSSGGWWTLRELSTFCGGSEAGVSARLRDLRKPKFGGHEVERERVPGGRGLWRYRLLAKEEVSR